MLPRLASVGVLFVGYILLEALFQRKAVYQQRNLQQAQARIAELISRLDSVSLRVVRVKEELHSTLRDEAHFDVGSFTPTLERAESELLALYLAMKRIVTSTFHEGAFNDMNIGTLLRKMSSSIDASERLAQAANKHPLAAYAASAANNAQHGDGVLSTDAVVGNQNLRTLELELEDALKQAAKLRQDFKRIRKLEQEEKPETAEDEGMSWVGSILLAFLSFLAGLVGSYMTMGYYCAAEEHTDTFMWVETQEPLGLTPEERCIGA